MLTWRRIPRPRAAGRETRHQVDDAKHFDGGEGAWYADGHCWFTTKGDNRLWRYDAARNRLGVVHSDPLTGISSGKVDNVTLSKSGDVFVAVDGPKLAVFAITPNNRASAFLRITGHDNSEVTGPAFSPDGRRLYFSSQRGKAGDSEHGITYEVSGPFRRR